MCLKSCTFYHHLKVWCYALYLSDNSSLDTKVVQLNSAINHRRIMYIMFLVSGRREPVIARSLFGMGFQVVLHSARVYIVPKLDLYWERPPNIDVVPN